MSLVSLQNGNVCSSRIGGPIVYRDESGKQLARLRNIDQTRREQIYFVVKNASLYKCGQACT